MERQLGLRAGQQPIDDWEKEVAAATHPQIRHFGVAQEKSLTPLATVKGAWTVCSPETVKDFTAVGYFFGRDLERARHVPIGIIHSSWGGTPAEAWTSEAGLRALPDFADVGAEIKTLIADPEAARRAYEAKLETWFAANDTGSVAGKLGAIRRSTRPTGRRWRCRRCGRTRASRISTASSGFARPSTSPPRPPTPPPSCSSAWSTTSTPPGSTA